MGTIKTQINQSINILRVVDGFNSPVQFILISSFENQAEISPVESIYLHHNYKRERLFSFPVSL